MGKSVKLIFWKTYLEEYLAKDLQARRAKKMPDCTTVYDPQTQEAKLVTWDAYLRTHKPPPAGHYTTVYDPKTQSCKLVTWRDYLEYHKANDMKKPQQQPQQQSQKVCGGAAKKAIPEYTAVYDEETRTVKLQLWDEYIKANRPKWTQSYAAVYDPATQSVKAIYWRQYKEEYLKKEVKEAKKEVKTAKKAAKAVQSVPTKLSSMTRRPRRPNCSPCLSTSGRTNQSGPKPTRPCTIQQHSQSSSSTGSNILKTTSPKIWRPETPKDFQGRPKIWRS